MITACTTIKRENRYLDEWIAHHMSIGIDRFVIFDNNDNREDYPLSELLLRQVTQKNIKVINCRNKKLDFNYIVQEFCKACTTEWAVFLDVDEFIVLEEFDKLPKWLSKECFKDAVNIRVPVISYGDNDILYADGNYNVRSRFTKPAINSNKFNNAEKTFIRMTGIHGNESNLLKNGIVNGKTVYANGEEMHFNIKMPRMQYIKDIYVAAYPTKSLEEYCLVKVGRNRKYDENKIDEYKKQYFIVNKHSEEKETLFNELINKIYFGNEKHYGMHSYANVYFGDGKSTDA